MCITLVIAAHAAHEIPEGWKWAAGYLFDGGPLGVTVFFVLSGFLITYLLVGEECATGRISIRAFYARRALRILPVYLAYGAAMALLDRGTPLDLGKCDYVTTLTYTRNLGLCGQWIDGHLWSLSVEEQFYLLWPVTLACLRPRARRWVIAAFIVLAPVCRVVFLHNGWWDLAAYSLMTNVDALMIGSVVGMAFFEMRPSFGALLKYQPALVRGAAVALILALVVLGHVTEGAVSVVAFHSTLMSLAAAYLVVSYTSRSGGAVHAFLNWRPVRYVGVLSYSIYIWQQLFLNSYYSYGYESPPALLRFPTNVVLSLAVAALSYHALEKPVLSLRKRFRPTEASEPDPKRVAARAARAKRPSDQRDVAALVVAR